MSARAPILEVGQHTLSLLDGSDGFEAELERDEQLRLTRSCITRLTISLREWATAHGWERDRTIWCAIGGRGVSLRRLELPATAVENLESVLGLQIESEFPVPPSELAWGFMQLGSGTPAAPMSVLVGAIKPEALQDLKELCTAAGLQPIFTVAALARSSLCPPNGPTSFAILHVEKHQSELVSFEDRAPETVRLIRWGIDDAHQVLGSELQLTAEAALREFRSSSTPPARREVLRLALLKAFQPLRAQLQPSALGQALFCSGSLPTQEGVESLITPETSIGLRLERLPYTSGPGRTAATQGIHDWGTRFPGIPLLQLQSRGSHTPLPTRRASPFRWALVAALLILGLVSLRYIEPLLGKGRLARRLDEIEKQKALLPKIEQELSFLQNLQRTQPPFLEAIATLAQSASPGLRLDSLNMNRRGEVSLRGNFANGAQAVDLRLKLIESGFFSSVVVEEQTPTPDRNQVIVRMTAQWKSPEERLTASLKAASRPRTPIGEAPRPAAIGPTGAINSAAPPKSTPDSRP